MKTLLAEAAHPGLNIQDWLTLEPRERRETADSFPQDLSCCSLLLARVTQRWACWQVAKIWRNRFIESKRLFLFQNKCNQLFLFRSLFSLILGSGRKKSEVVGSGWECSEVTTFSTIIDLCRGLIMMANPFGNPGTAVWPACFFRS